MHAWWFLPMGDPLVSRFQQANDLDFWGHRLVRTPSHDMGMSRKQQVPQELAGES